MKQHFPYHKEMMDKQLLLIYALTFIIHLTSVIGLFCAYLSNPINSCDF